MRVVTWCVHDAAGKDPITNLQDHVANPWIANFTTNSASPSLHCTDAFQNAVLQCRLSTRCPDGTDTHVLV